MKKIQAYLFPTVMLLTSLLMAAIAAFISISGLSKLFSGAGSTIILMMSGIEFSKIIITTYIHKKGLNKKNLLLNIPLIFITVVIMAVTSLGVYGFLANGYTVTAGHLNKNKGEVSLIENKISNSTKKIESLNSRKENSNNRAVKLTDLRSQQEIRIDSLYSKGWYKSARKVETQVRESNEEIKRLMNDVSKMDSTIQLENESIGVLRNEIIDLSNNEVNAELGPLKYISDMTGLSMDNVINYVILVLIFIFDPAAILMLIAANNMFNDLKKELEEPIVPVETPKSLSNVVKSDFDDNVRQEYFEYLDRVMDDNKAQRKKGVEESSLEKNQPKKETLVMYSGASNHSFEEEGEKPLVGAYSGVNKSVESFFKEKEKTKTQFIELVNKKNETTPTIKEVKVPVEQDVELMYTKLMSVLYKGGKINKGEDLPSYKDFQEMVVDIEFELNEKFILDFLSACNLACIIDTSKEKRKALKSFDEANAIVKNIGDIIKMVESGKEVTQEEIQKVANK